MYMVTKKAYRPIRPFGVGLDQRHAELASRCARQAAHSVPAGAKRAKRYACVGVHGRDSAPRKQQWLARACDQGLRVTLLRAARWLHPLAGVGEGEPCSIPKTTHPR